MKNAFLILVLAIFIVSCHNQERVAENIPRKGMYAGEKVPLNQPELFAPGFISTGLYTRDITISPDGNEIFFGVIMGRSVFIMETHIENGIWTTPKVASFSGSDLWFDFEPHISPDGKRFFMLSTRPPEGMEPKPGWSYQNIWAMDKTENGWTEPYLLGEPISTEQDEFYASATLNGTLYFTRSSDVQKSAIWRSEMVDGNYSKPEKLVFNNDTTLEIYNSMIAPDESYIIVCVNHINDSIDVP